jgi:hypothetical protein
MALEVSALRENVIMKERFCRKLANCAGFALLFLLPVSGSAQQVQKDPIVVHATNHATTPRALRDMTPVPWPNASKVMRRPGRAPHPHIGLVPDASSEVLPEALPEVHTDSLLPGAPIQSEVLPSLVPGASIQSEVVPEVLPQVRTTSLLNFDGITAAQGGGFVPPDTNASVGATQVVETVNVAYAVYNKTTGAQIMAPKNIQTLYAPLGGQCATGNLSDPIVTYDKAAGRWVISMVAFNNSFTVNEICVAVSTSSDATGSFNLYSFSFGTTLPDYPKLAVWPDAYYLTANGFASNANIFVGVRTCALDRTAMLAGSAATAICFSRGTSDFSLLPADLDGATAPPAGAPNYQLELATSTTLNLFKFHVDFTVPANSTFTGPTVITVPPYTDACVASGGICIPQPSPGERLDSLGDRLMHRLAYRNFGTHEALVANHTIRAVGTGGAAAAVRWYEIRSPGSVPVAFQRGRVGGGTLTVARWMGSIAMDKNGDIALGFSRSNSAAKPAITYVGRMPSDPRNTMESPKVIVLGNGVQINSGHRWGDYSSMAIDPSDDCTFWYAQEYYKTTGAFNWATRLASFKFQGCT